MITFTTVRRTLLIKISDARLRLLFNFRSIVSEKIIMILIMDPVLIKTECDLMT